MVKFVFKLMRNYDMFDNVNTKKNIRLITYAKYNTFFINLKYGIFFIQCFHLHRRCEQN